MLNKLKPTQYLVVAGGALVLIFGLLRWFTWDLKQGDVVIQKDQKANAFDYLLTGVVPWILVVGVAVVTVLLAAGALNPGKVPWPLVTVAATVFGAILIIIRLADRPERRCRRRRLGRLDTRASACGCLPWARSSPPSVRSSRIKPRHSTAARASRPVGARSPTGNCRPRHPDLRTSRTCANFVARR